MRNFRWLVLLLVSCCLAALAHAAGPAWQPLTLAAGGAPVDLSGRALAWIDRSGQRDAGDVAAASAQLPWAPFQPARPYRIDDQALWLQLDAQVMPGSRWYLELQHPAVDLIQLFYRDAQGRWVTQSAGQRLPVSDWALPGRLPSFELAPAQAGAVRYWVRLVRRQSDYSVPLRLYEERDWLESRALNQFWLGTYFGVLAFLTAVAVVSAAVYRDRNFAAFAVYLGAIAAVQLVVLGVGAQQVWPEAANWNLMARLVLPGPAAAVALWFVKVLTEPARFSRALDLACWSAVAALLAAVAVNAFVDSRASFALVSLLMVATIPLALGLLLLAWRRGRDPYMGTLLLSFLPPAAAAVLPLAATLNLLPNSALTRHALTVGTVLQLPLLYYALSRRALRRREPQMRAAALGHTDALTGLADRDTLVHRLEDAQRRAISQRHQCAALAVRLTNYDALMDQFGRAIADRALLVAASIVRGAASDIDLPARTGERDFALLLEGPITGDAALARAQQIVARGLQHAPVLPPATALKLHVAVALLPDQALDAAHCLPWLEQACDAMRADPRRAIRALNF